VLQAPTPTRACSEPPHAAASALIASSVSEAQRRKLTSRSRVNARAAPTKAAFTCRAAACLIGLHLDLR
jgi:hypothetical protein